MKDFLKGTGLSTDKDTAYYVNYGVMDSEADATKALALTPRPAASPTSTARPMPMAWR